MLRCRKYMNKTLKTDVVSTASVLRIKQDNKQDLSKMKENSKSKVIIFLCLWKNLEKLCDFYHKC